MALPQIDALIHGFGADYNAGTATAYKAGTSVLATWYEDAAGTSPAANPYTLNSVGAATLYCASRIKLDVKNSIGVSAPGFPIDNLGFGVYAPDNWTIASDYGAGKNDTTIAAAIAAVGVNKGTIYLDSGTWTIENNLTIPANINLIMDNGAICSVNAGKTLTVTGSINSGLYQIFAGDGSVAGLEVVMPEWFGAVGDNVTDDTAPIIKAIAAASGQAVLAHGPYVTTAPLTSGKGVATLTGGAGKDIWLWTRNFTGTKTTGGGTDNMGYGPAGFQFDIRYDNADAGTDFVRALSGRDVFGGTDTKGGRIGVLGETLHNLGATEATNANRNYVGVVGVSSSEQGDGGTNTGAGAKGAYFGLNGIGRAMPGATNLFEVSGAEINTYVDSTASSKYILGLTVAGFNEVQGAVADAAIEIGGGTDSGFGPHVGWNYGILFSDIHGGDPTNTNSALMGAYWTDSVRRTINHGIDLSQFTITNAIIQGAKAVLAENTLVLGASGANVSSITAGNGSTNANLDLIAKGTGAVRLTDGGGVNRLKAASDHGLTFIPKSSATPASNGDVVMEATSNTQLTFKLKGSDGTVRSAVLTLA